MKKRILSLLLAIVMVVGLVPGLTVTASAVDGNEAIWGTSADDLGGEGREGTLAEAVAAAKGDSDVKYIKMVKSVTITLENGFAINGGNFTLDMGGYELSWGGYRLYIYGGKVVFKNGTFESSANQAIWVDGDMENTEITFESGIYKNPGHSFVYVKIAKKLTVKKDVTIQAGIPLELGSDCAASLIEGATLLGTSADVTLRGGTNVVTEGVYDFDVLRDEWSLDLSTNLNPVGTTFISGNGYPTYIQCITMPDGYGLFDLWGKQHTDPVDWDTPYQNKLTIRSLHTHEWQYTSEGSTITATCKDITCGEDAGSVTLAAPDSTKYTGNPIEATVTDELTTGDIVTVTYSGDNLAGDLPVKIGTYTATITLGEGEDAASISVTYTITHAEHNYTYSNITDDQHTESCECGYEATVPHEYDEEAHLCACGDVERFTVTYTDGVPGRVIFEDQVFENLPAGAPTPEFDPMGYGYQGFAFDGWKPVMADTVTGNVTYVAQWRQTYFQFDTPVNPTERPDIPVTPPAEQEETGCGGTMADGCPSASFSDLDTRAWYHEATDYVLANQLMLGTSTTEQIFEPNGTATRAMIVTVLWRLDGSPEMDYQPIFRDVAEDEWYTDAILWAAENGVTLGYGTGAFGVDDPITREQLISFLHRYAEYLGLTEDTVPAVIAPYEYSDWAENAVIWAHLNGLLSDFGVNMYDLTAEASRVEIAELIYRFCENIIK